MEFLVGVGYPLKWNTCPTCGEPIGPTLEKTSTLALAVSTYEKFLELAAEARASIKLVTKPETRRGVPPGVLPAAH